MAGWVPEIGPYPAELTSFQNPWVPVDPQQSNFKYRWTYNEHGSLFKIMIIYDIFYGFKTYFKKIYYFQIKPIKLTENGMISVWILAVHIEKLVVSVVRISIHLQRETFTWYNHIYNMRKLIPLGSGFK